MRCPSVVSLCVLCGCAAFGTHGVWDFTGADGKHLHGDVRVEGDEVCDSWTRTIGQETGALTVWWDSRREKKQMEVRFAKGKMTGPIHVWHASGRMKCVGTLNEGRNIGCWTYWHENGRTAEQDVVSDLGGMIATWWPSGQRRSLSISTRERDHMQWKWDSEGNLIETLGKMGPWSSEVVASIPTCQQEAPELFELCQEMLIAQRGQTNSPPVKSSD